MRTLNGTALLLWVNSATIVLSVGLCLGALIAEGSEATLARSGGSTHLVATGLGWRQLTSGVSKMAFAYVGVLMYPEIILEMEQPRDFPKALYAGAPFQLAAFMTVSCVGPNPSPKPSPKPSPNPYSYSSPGGLRRLPLPGRRCPRAADQRGAARLDLAHLRGRALRAPTHHLPHQGVPPLGI